MKIAKGVIFLRERQELKYVLFGVLVAMLVSVYGAIGSIGVYQRGLDTGDGATFHEFARNIVSGESIYKDFIHFRTPGSYFLWAPFIALFGDKQSSISLAINVETRILYPLVFLISALIIFRRAKRRYLLTMISLFAVFLPPITQLRAGFALLAIAVYMVAINVQPQSAKRKDRYYLLTGILVGISFIFGQETALMATSVIAVFELFALRISKNISNILLLLTGFILAISPLIAYVILNSSIKNFLYYTLYYSFIQQPKFMDVPYPAFNYTNLIFFLPFILYFLLFTILFLNDKPKREHAILLAFAFMRMITALGRSDILHLFFSIGEACIVTPLILSNITSISLTKAKLRRFFFYGAVLASVIVLSIYSMSLYMFLAPVIIVFAIQGERSQRSAKESQRNWLSLNLYAATCCTLIIIAYLMVPSIKNSLLTFVDVARGERYQSGYMISGKYVDKATYDEVSSTIAEINKIHPKTIFSFPIQPFYYTLSDRHASRFITFEPQVTDSEELQAIQDLKNSRPELIVFDPLQAESLSGSLEQINRFILENYRTTATINGKNIIWIMVPSTAGATYPLLFDLKFSNVDSKSFGIQSPEKGINNAIAQKDTHLNFDTRNSKKLELEVTVPENQNDFASCGTVELLNQDGSAERYTVCHGQSRRQIDIGKARSIRLINNDSQKMLLWNNVLIGMSSGL